jgi:hypothetical protein
MSDLLPVSARYASTILPVGDAGLGLEPDTDLVEDGVAETVVGSEPLPTGPVTTTPGSPRTGERR